MELPYRGLKIEVPIEALQVEYFSLQEALNEHARLVLHLLIEEEKILKVAEEIDGNTCIAVYEPHRETKKDIPIFKGKVINVETIEKGQLQHLALECISYTYEWDLEKKSRTFCDLDLTYKQVIERVLGDYNKTDFQDSITKDKKIPHFLLQYEETDWTFLKRLATHFETFLLSDSTEDHGRAYFGFPRLQYQMELNQQDYTIRKDLEKYYFFNKLETYFPQEAITWHIETPKRLYIGEEVLFKNIETQVTKVTLHTGKDELVYGYELSRLKGVRTPYQNHPDIYGMSLPATVKERKGNCIRVHFAIDPVYEAKPQNQYFTYALESSSWYCMPEEGSKVHIYFPSHNEKEAIAIHAIRSTGNNGKYIQKSQNPDYKSFSNVTGSEMQLTPSTISFAADEAKKISVTLDQSGNIALLGETLSFKSDKSITIGDREAPSDPKLPHVRPKTINITAKERLTLVREEDPSQGFTLEEDHLVMATFLKKEASLKKPSVPSPDTFDQSANDDALIKAHNDKAKQGLEEKRDQSLGNIKKGLASIAKVAAVGILVAATGGLAAGPLVTVLVVGSATAKVAMSVSDIVEGVQDYNKSQSGDLTKSFNPIRDKLFGGNEDLYRGFQAGVDLVFGIVSSVVLAGNISNLSSAANCGQMKKMGLQLLLRSKDMIIDDLVQDGKINIGNLGFNLAFSYFSGRVTGGVSQKLTGKIFKEVPTLLNSKIGEKVTKIAVETGVDTTMEGILAFLTGSEFDFKKSLTTNALANGLAEVVGDPIDTATGSLIVTSTDFILADIPKDFTLERRYSSIDKDVGILGKGWRFNYDSQIFKDENRVHLSTVTGHMLCFERIAGQWQNIEGEKSRFSLKHETVPYQWILEDCHTGQRYIYDQAGKLNTIVDKNYQKTILSYEGDTLAKIKTSLGYELTFTFKDHKLIQITDDIGRTIQYKYKGELLTHVVHVDTGITQYTYNEEGYIETIKDQNGTVYSKNTYNAEGRVILQELSNGDTYSVTYDTENRRNIFEQGSSKKIEIYHYNPQYMLTQIDYGDGSNKQYGYDAYKNRNYIKNRLGHITESTYSTYGYILEEKLPNGRLTTYRYDENHQLIQKKDNAGRESLYSYDTKGNLIEERHKIATGKWQRYSYQYDHRGRVLEVEDSLKSVTSYSYQEDQKGPRSVKSPLGDYIHYEYDKVGRRMSIENQNGTMEFTYNNLNRITQEKDPEGHTSHRIYDRMGNLISYYPAKAWANKERGYTYKYDFLDRLVEVIDPLENHFKQVVDTEGNVIKSIHPNSYSHYTREGEGTEYIYNHDNRCIKKINIDGGIERFFYDSEGNLIKHILPEYYDPNKDDGMGYSYHYNEMNQLTKVLTPEGSLEKIYTYDYYGNIIKETDAKGFSTFYQYDLSGNLIEKREPVKKEDEKVQYKLRLYEYDTEGNKIAEKYGKDYVGEKNYPVSYHSLNFCYDKNHRLIQVKDDYGAEINYRYNSLGQKIYEERKINQQSHQCIHYIYNKSGWLIEKKEEVDSSILGEKERSGLWAITKYQYDPNGNITEVETPRGYKIKRRYDLCDRLMEDETIDKENGIHRITNYTYDAAGNIIKVTEKAKGQEDTEYVYTYDLKDRLTHIKTPEGSITRYQYDKNDRLIKEILPENYNLETDDGPGTRYSYNHKGLVEGVTNSFGEKIQENIYDPVGNLKTQKDALGNPINYTYTPDNQLQHITSGLKEKSLQSYDYNARGQMIGVKDGKQQQTQYKVDDWGRITEIIGADGSVEKYTYDYAGNITSTTDGNGNTITYRYNSYNKVSEVIDQEGKSEYYYYDEEKRLKIHIDRNGNKREISYNVDGNITEEKIADTKENSILRRTYTYDPKGRLETAQTGGFAYKYVYTKEGRLQSKSTCGKKLIEYTYNKNGEIATIKDITGKVAKYIYDLNHRLEQIRDENDNVIAHYSYTVRGEIESITYKNGLKTNYSYDEHSNIRQIVTETTTGEKLIDLSYKYDQNGNRLEKISPEHHVQYSYDPLNRLTEAIYNGRKESYTYDKAGNRLSKTTEKETENYTYNSKNQIIQWHKASGTTTFTYDNQGNIIEEKGPEGTARYEYNPLNQQTKVVTNQGHIQINRYDAEGLRAEIEENERLTKFIFHKGNVVVETNKEDHVIARLIRGYEVVASNLKPNTSEISQTDRYNYYSQDEQGSTLYITDENQTVQNAYTYDAFGNIITKEENIQNRITYTGQQYDAITQQYYLRARYYNPIIGRFTQEDVYRGDGLNLYAYCANNPVNYYDPSGYNKDEGLCGPKGNTINKDDSNVQNEGTKDPKLYRKMSVAEAEKTIESGLQPARRGSDPTKWTSESLEKVKEFDNKIVKPGTEEVIIEFEINQEYYKNMQETAVPQHGSKGNPNIKYHYEGLEIDGQYKNYGITPEQIDIFNKNILNIRIVKE